MMAEDNTNLVNSDSSEIAIRRNKLLALQSGRAGDPYGKTSYEVEKHSKEIAEHFDELDGKETKIAGRIVSKRMMGKASFFHVQDALGSIQCYARKDVLGEEEYAQYKTLDVGDIVGIAGEVFRTNAGEVTVKCHEVVLLAKALLPLPEKFHGLKDTELRYRQRYVDLIVNPEVRETFIKRSRLFRVIRNYLDSRGYMEVETPILHPIAGGAAAKPFCTHHNTLDIPLYLRIATELHLKRLIVGGFDKVYEIGRMFRNEGMDIRHNPEFTLMELYEAYTDYKGMMALAEELLAHCAKELTGDARFTYQGTEIDMTPPWNRMTMAEAVKQFTGVDFMADQTDEGAQKIAEVLNLSLENVQKTWGPILNAAFEAFVEEKLVQPTFITEYPVEISPLAKGVPGNPRLTERFELFITGREFANAYSELNDPIVQKARFEEQLMKRNAGDEEVHMMDEDFITALEYGMPPTGGIGIGIDRLVMLLTDSYSIRDVLLFPTMKPKG